MVKFIKSKDFTPSEFKVKILQVRECKQKIIETFELFPLPPTIRQIILRYGLYRYILNLPEIARE
jgi:hypothetical protein